MLEGGSSQARDAALLKNVKTDEKIAIGVVDRTRTTVESPRSGIVSLFLGCTA